MYQIVWLILRDQQGQVLLARREGTTYGPGLWNLPGGKVEFGESLPAAVRREAQEEVGITLPGDLEFLGVSRYDLLRNGEQVRGVDFFFGADGWDGVPQPLENTSEVGWFAVEALPLDSLPWLRDVLLAHVQGAMITEQLNAASEEASVQTSVRRDTEAVLTIPI